MSGISKAKHQRNRLTVVCTNCKARKIKCDRKEPCQNCIKSSLISSCCYVREKSDNHQKRNNENEHPNNESLLGVNCDSVETLINNGSSPSDVDSNASTIRHNEKSILDIKCEIVERRYVFLKPSRTQLRNLYADAYVREEHTLVNTFILPFKNLLNSARKRWKSKNFDKNFDLFNFNYNRNSQINNDYLNSTIERLICENYNAVLERLSYFQKELNKILFNSYIPMGVVQLIFHHYFCMKPHGVEFRKPKKNFEYIFISLITSIIELTNIFGRFEASQFNFRLPYQNNEFNEISVCLLNASNYTRKSSVFAVYTLLNLRLSLMIYGDAQSGGVANQNTYSFFQTAVNLCNVMGISIDQDRMSYIQRLNLTDETYKDIGFVKDITSDQIKTLWNYIVVLDATYFISMTAPPMIDNRYYHGIYLGLCNCNKHLDDFVSTIRELSLTILKGEGVSLSELLNSILKINSLLATFDSFNDFSIIENSDDKWRTTKMKFELLDLLFSLNLYLNLLLKEKSLIKKYPAEVLNNKRNQEIISALKKETTLKCKLIYFIVMNSILNISVRNLNSKFLIYIREIFSTWLGIHTIIFIDIIIKEDMEYVKNKNDTLIDLYEGLDNFRLPDAPVFDTKELEVALIDFNFLKYSKTLKFVEKSSEPKQMASFLTLIYGKAIQIPILFSDYRFFVMTKLSLITIYFLYGYIKVHKEESFSVTEYFDELKQQTLKIITNHLENGRLTHLVGPDDIMDVTNKDFVGNTDLEKSSLDDSTVDMNLKNYEADNPSTVLEPSLVDNLATSVFQDEALTSIFNDINQYFNLADI